MRLIYNKGMRTIVSSCGIMWGAARDNGVWVAPVSHWRFMFRKHDALYVAAGRLRLRIMKWWQR